jgi:hypothetical protein
MSLTMPRVSFPVRWSCLRTIDTVIPERIFWRMCPSGIRLRFLLSSLVNGCLFSQSGFHVFTDVRHPE